MFILSSGCTDKDSLKIEGTVECIKNPYSVYGVEYQVNYTLTNEGDEPIEFNHMTIAFENNIDEPRSNLLIHDFNDTIIEPGKPKSYSFTSGRDTDRLMDVSKNGKTALGILLHNNEEGVIYFRIAELPSLIAKNGHEIEIHPGESQALGFTEDDKSVTEAVNE